MKSIKQLSFILLAIMLVLTSCTNEKRVSMSGYHTEWLTAKHKGHNGAYKSCSLCTPKDNVHQSDESTAMTFEQQTTELGITEDNAIVADDLLEMMASADNNQIILPKSPNNYLLAKTTVAPNKGKDLKRTFKSNFKKESKITKVTPSDDEQGMSGMAIAGFICGIVGLLLVLITGWPFLLGTLGIIFSAIGLKQTSEGKTGKGFAIAGLVTSILAIVLFWMWVAIIGFLLL